MNRATRNNSDELARHNRLKPSRGFNMCCMILGPAGSGKSLLTGQFGGFLKKEGYSVKLVNIDPGSLSLPYVCDFDIREKFTVENIMREEKLGPNGAMIRAMDLLSETRIPKYEGDFILIDTPGQLEIFVFHESGPKIVEQFDNLVGIFIIDASIGFKDLPAAYLYSLAARYRLGINAANILNKVDLLEDREVKRVSDYLFNPTIFEREAKPKGVLSDIYLPLSELLRKVVPAQRIPLVSAQTGKGFDELLDILYEIRCACGDLT